MGEHFSKFMAFIFLLVLWICEYLGDISSYTDMALQLKGHVCAAGNATQVLVKFTLIAGK